MIDDFKEIHKQSETLRNSGFNTADIKKDISSMEDEKDQLIKRIDRLKRKVNRREMHPFSDIDL
jgi:intraflagellar transport protein 81